MLSKPFLKLAVTIKERRGIRMQRYRLRRKIFVGELLMMVLVICRELEMERRVVP